jgi:hypothetical protein
MTLSPFRLASTAALIFAACALPSCGDSFGSGDGTGGQAGTGGQGGECDWQGQTRAHGSSFPAGDGCNTCTCLNSRVACTTGVCGEQCSYNGSTYQVGDTFPAGDGCNTCSCDSGGFVGCTLIACDECLTIEGAYAAAFDQARACDPQLAGQCTQRIIGGLVCGCDTFVNPANAGAITTAEAARGQYNQLACAGDVLCGPCASPTSGYCSPEGLCTDVWGVSCKVNGIVYPSGSSNLPDPFSCNTCSCLDGQLSCTDIACPLPCPSGTIPSTQCAQCGPTDGCEVVEHACLPVCTSTCTTGLCLDGACKTVCG